MDLAPFTGGMSGFMPPAAMAEDEQETPLSIEEAFAQVLGLHMRGEYTIEETVYEWESVCRQRAVEYEHAAGAQAHSPVASMHYAELAESLWSEASTWKLVRHMFHSGDLAAGPLPVAAAAAPAPGCGDLASLLQQQERIVGSDPDLRRAAQVVSWLEEMAGDALDGAGPARERRQVAASRFAPGQSLWTETADALRQRAPALREALVDTIDPDATSRKGGRGSLMRGDCREEERLLEAVWRLLRAGRTSEALQLCSDCGASWRAASLSAADGCGMLPVGAACDTARPLQQETLRQGAAAADVFVGQGAAAATGQKSTPAIDPLHAEWRSACLAAAQSAIAHAGAQPAHAGASMWEAAVYSSLAGHLEGILPVCRSWEDECWAHARALLQTRPSALLQETFANENTGAAANVAQQDPALERPWSVTGIMSRCQVAPVSLPTELGVSHASNIADMLDVVQTHKLKLHQAVQRSLIATACAPSATCPVTAIPQHPCHHLLLAQLPLTAPVAPGTSELADNQRRFGVHLALALVALGAVPSSPGHAQTLWHEVSLSPEGDLLQAGNYLLDEYIDVLVCKGERHRYLVPQYMCMLRGTLTHVILRRYMQHVMPRLEAACLPAIVDATAALLSGRVPASMSVRTAPAEAALDQLLAPAQWAICQSALSDMVAWFHLWRLKPLDVDTSVHATGRLSVYATVRLHPARAHHLAATALAIADSDMATEHTHTERTHPGTNPGMNPEMGDFNPTTDFNPNTDFNPATTQQQQQRPALPRTPVQLDEVLCVGVARSRRRLALSSVERVAMLRWLLLPYAERAALRRPFSSLQPDDSAASTCWLCAIKAIFHAVDLCRDFCLAGTAHRWAALAALDRVLGMSGTNPQQEQQQQQQQQQDGTGDGHSPFLTHVAAMLADAESDPAGTAHPEHASLRAPPVDTVTAETYAQLRVAVAELREWRALLRVEARVAALQRSVAARALNALPAPLLLDVLSDLDALANASAVLASGPGASFDAARHETSLSLLVTVAAGSGAADELWGSAAVAESAVPMAPVDAETLAGQLQEAVERRVGSGGGVRVRVRPVGVRDGLLPDAGDRHGDDAAQGDPGAGAVVLVLLEATGPQSSTERPAAELIAAAAADMLRGDLPTESALLQQLHLHLISAASPWAAARSVHNARAALVDVHKRHVQGEVFGRSAALQRLCSTVQCAHVVGMRQRVRKWALQMGMASGTGAGGPEPDLESLSERQLAVFLEDEYAGVLTAHTLAQGDPFSFSFSSLENELDAMQRRVLSEQMRVEQLAKEQIDQATRGVEDVTSQLQDAFPAPTYHYQRNGGSGGSRYYESVSIWTSSPHQMQPPTQAPGLLIPAVAASLVVAVFAAVGNRLRQNFVATRYKQSRLWQLVLAWPFLLLLSADFREQFWKAMRYTEGDEIEGELEDLKSQSKQNS